MRGPGAMPAHTVASFIAEALRSLGVERIYGIIGTSILDFLDTLYEYKAQLRYVSTRHEQVAVSMADAETRLTGIPGAATVHAGPGFLNTLISLGIAYKDRSPLLLVSGGVRRRLYGTDSWLEVDQQRLAAPITRAAARLIDPEKLPETLEHLLRQALSPPRGPVVLEVPEDLWGATVDGDPSRFTLDRLASPGKEPPASKVAEILDSLGAYEKPLILACGEANRPGIEEVLAELAERLGAYVVVSGNGRGACDELHPRCLGRVGFGGGSIPADRALEESDFLLVLGDELDDITTYAYMVNPGGEVVVVSENPVVERRPIYFSERIDADPYRFAAALLREARGRNLSRRLPGWDSIIEKYRSEWRRMVEESLSRRYEGYANPSKFFKALAERLPEKNVVTGGQGTHILYAYNYLPARRPGSFLAATNLGAMGFAFPAALAAKLARPDHEVIAVVGDGEFMMTLQDLETAVRERIPVRVVVVNDMSYRVLLLRQRIQKMGRVIGTLHGNPDFAELARSFGAEGASVKRDEDIEGVLGEMLASDKPFVVDLRISREDLPPLNIDASLRMGRA